MYLIVVTQSNNHNSMQEEPKDISHAVAALKIYVAMRGRMSAWLIKRHSVVQSQ